MFAVPPDPHELDDIATLKVKCALCKITCFINTMLDKYNDCDGVEIAKFFAFYSVLHHAGLEWIAVGKVFSDFQGDWGSLKPRGSQVRQVVSENAINSPTYTIHNSRRNRFCQKNNTIRI